MGLADLHIHTTYSHDGTCTVSAILKYVADRTDLNVIAITDHDQIAGALEAQDRASAYGIEVITGCEISTAEGHLLALFIQEKIATGLSLVETLLRVGDQGGVCIAAHPMARGASSLTFGSIRHALSVPEAARILVGIEVFNAGLVNRQSNFLTWSYARHLPLAFTANSDSHILRTLGQGATIFDGSSAADLRMALEAGTTTIQISPRLLSGLSIIGSFIPMYLLRSAGWVAWNPEPQAPIRIGRFKKHAMVQQPYSL